MEGDRMKDDKYEYQLGFEDGFQRERGYGRGYDPEMKDSADYFQGYAKGVDAGRTQCERWANRWES